MVVTKDEKDSCRSLVCDANGIIIAEMVYRCMICSNISDSVSEAQKHYRYNHIDNDELFDKTESELNGKHEDTATPTTTTLASNKDSVNEQLNLENKSLKMESEMEEEEICDDLDDLSYLDHYDTFEQSANESYEASSSLSSISFNKSIKSQGNSLADRGGFVTCAVCNVTKFYASVQRRYGQFTCMGCAKFFGRFLTKPRRYSCPKLGSCSLNSGPRCKACLLLACINTYQIDEKRMAIINAYRPLRKALPKQQNDLSNHSSENINNTTNDLEFETILPNDDLPEMVPINISLTGKTTAIKPKPVQNSKKSSNRVSPFKTSVKKNWGCRKCPGCLVEDCGKCNYCRDKPKFGGPNTLKKKCILRKCFVLEEQKEREASERLSKK